MAKFYVYTSRPSKGARALAKALNGRRVRDPAKIISEPSYYDEIINWGDSQCPVSEGSLNNPSAVRLVANKLTAFDAFSSANVPIPAYARRKEDVTWSEVTVVRHKLTGHSGEGIEICDAGSLPDAPLYVQYIKKEQEYRVHVGKRGEASIIIAVQRKARDKSNPHPDWQVRNHHNGFVFVRGGFTPPESVVDAAKQALVCSGLDFGAVDVIYNQQQGKAYVLEINTAPGLEGQTVQDYANFFKGLPQ